MNPSAPEGQGQNDQFAQGGAPGLPRPANVPGGFEPQPTISANRQYRRS